MTERPILFSAAMVRAILEGRKTQTRRVAKIKWKPGVNPNFSQLWCNTWGSDKFMIYGSQEACEPFRPPCVGGDMLWVREAFSYSWSVKDDPERRHLMPCWYWADGNPIDGDWSKPKPSIHMPRWASRITLRVTAVKVERLQDISEEDAEAEGIDIEALEPLASVDARLPTAREEFQRLWESIHGAGAWDANPWVAAISFERVNP